jgi:hypothetical protein
MSEDTAAWRKRMKTHTGRISEDRGQKNFKYTG